MKLGKRLALLAGCTPHTQVVMGSPPWLANVTSFFNRKTAVTRLPEITPEITINIIIYGRFYLL